MEEVGGPNPWAYGAVRALFKATSGIFYASFDVRGQSNVPEEGVPTVLCFNHGNSLGDSICVIRSTPRPVAFTAKDTLWKMPFISQLVRWSGAIPVYRRLEHGNNAREHLADTFRSAYAALEQGRCLAFAPEGVSKFRSYATKFKNGVGFIVVDVLVRAFKRGDTEFSVKLLPTVLMFTHREKFRSDALVRFLKPIEFNLDFLKEIGFDFEKLENLEQTKKAAVEVVRRLETKFDEHIMNAPDWETVNLAITATRIHRPLGTFMSLDTYMHLLHGWVNILKKAKVDPIPEDEKILVDNLKKYQALLNEVQIKDERFRRIQIEYTRPNFWKTLRIVSYRGVLCSLALLIATPGLLIWSPFWFLIKRKERQVLLKERTWVDSIAESKMKYGFFSLIVLGAWANKYALVLFAYLWLTMRMYEEGVASARSIIGIIRLYRLSGEKFRQVLEQRQKTEKRLVQCLKYFPAKNARRILKGAGDDVYKMLPVEDEVKRPHWYSGFNLLRRRKKDWNEILRLSDYCTMDYVD